MKEAIDVAALATVSAKQGAQRPHIGHIDAAQSFALASEYLADAAMMIARGAPSDCPEVAQLVQWGARKAWQGTEELKMGRMMPFDVTETAPAPATTKATTTAPAKAPVTAPATAPVKPKAPAKAKVSQAGDAQPPSLGIEELISGDPDLQDTLAQVRKLGHSDRMEQVSWAGLATRQKAQKD